MYKVEYAISVSIQQREGLWKITFPHPLDNAKQVSALVPTSSKDKRIGETIDKIRVANPGARLIESLDLLWRLISKYPYEWPWSGDSLNPYAHDFEVQMDLRADNSVSQIEISELAFLTLKEQIGKKPSDVEEETLEGIDKELLPEGGAYVKIHVTFDRPKPVSEINIEPFCELPMEAVSISYEEDIETFHPRKELVFRNKVDASVKTMTFQFPAVLARRFTIVFRQENYKRQPYNDKVAALTKQALWRMDNGWLPSVRQGAARWSDEVLYYMYEIAKQRKEQQDVPDWQYDKNLALQKHKEEMNE